MSDAARIRRMTDELIVARVRIGVWIMLAAIVTFSIADTIMRGPQGPLIHALQVAMAAAFAALLVLVRSPRLVGWARAFALAAVVIACALGTPMGVMITDAMSVVVMQIALVMGAATLVPWGVGPQTAGAVIVGASVWGAFYGISGELAPLGRSTTVSIAIVLLCSIYVAHVLAELQRRAAERDIELERSQESLRALSARIVSLQEEERAHIARELHDELGQLLVALKLELKRAAPGDERLERTRMILDETTHTVRNLSRELRPTALDDLGLAAALDSQVREFRDRTDIECELDLDGEELDADLDSARSTAVFRIIQEALTNVAQHADATRVAVKVQRRGGELVLSVEDDGRGITDAERADPASLGLIGMRERARNWGGDVDIRGRPAGGTSIRVTLPVGS